MYKFIVLKAFSIIYVHLYFYIQPENKQLSLKLPFLNFGKVFLMFYENVEFLSTIISNNKNQFHENHVYGIYIL